MGSDNKVSLFKDFVRRHSFLISYIRDGKKTWQDLYELYDLYGEDEDIWNSFLKEKDNTNNHYFDDIVKMIKNIDVDKVQEGITSMQKTLNLFGELFTGKENKNSGHEYNPRPLYRRFED